VDHSFPLVFRSVKLASTLHSLMSLLRTRSIFPNWCWAACIEMVFLYYGFEVPHQRSIFPCVIG